MAKYKEISQEKPSMEDSGDVTRWKSFRFVFAASFVFLQYLFGLVFLSLIIDD